MKVGLVPFLNVAPFRSIPFDITYAFPSKLNEMMRLGQLDAAFCSSIEYLEGDYERLPGWGLAARGRIDSVNLYLNGALEGAKIKLSPQSATSNALLRILCANKVTFTPDAENFLLIGDEALKTPTINGYKTIDLATWWYEKTALPFVFALFIKQKGVNSKALEEALAEALNHFEPKIGELANQHHFPKKRLIDYFNLCHYRLGPLEEKGLERFYDYQRALCQHCT